MIRLHQFNSEWWGQPAAIVDDPAFFLLPRQEQDRALSPFAWAEFRCDLSDEVSVHAIHDAGFFHVDTQIRFRIGLSALPDATSNCSVDGSVCSASDSRFTLAQAAWTSFEHERYRHLPGADTGRIGKRYALWAAKLVASNPADCLQVLHQGEPQGWFLAQKSSADSIRLTLALLQPNARISGYVLYYTALKEYAAMGYRIGTASFSISNNAVLNIYARLGARFVSPQAIWLWIPRSVSS